MQYSRLGESGMKVSRICLGMMSYGSKQWREWVLEEEASFPFIQESINLGINFFDTADVYSNGVSEEILGRALKRIGVPREHVIIASKCNGVMTSNPDTPLSKINNKGNSRKHIMESIDASLKRLGTDYIDLYQLHRWDDDTPIEETMEALHDLVRVGKVRYIGASSMYAWQFAKAQYTADKRGLTRFISMQNHYNLVYREEEREMIPFCMSEKVGCIPWSPLARGFLCGSRKPGVAHTEQDTIRARTDKFSQDMYYKEEDFKIVDKVGEIAANKKVSQAEVAMSWVLSKPVVSSVIVGATKMNHLHDAVKALNVKLTPEEAKQLEELYKPHPVLGLTFVPPTPQQKL